MPRRWIVILILSAIALVWGLLDGPAARQKRGIQAANALRDELRPKLAADSRFANVRLGVMTHPSLFIDGTVPDENALQDLKLLVGTPPTRSFHVNYSVKISDEPFQD